MNYMLYGILIIYGIILMSQVNMMKDITDKDLIDKSEIMYNLAMKSCSKNSWSIHGLWPEWRYQKGWPQYCKNVTFSIEKLTILYHLN